MKSQLKVAQLVPYYSPVIGGVEVVSRYISEELVHRGHEVHVFTANRNHKGLCPLSMPASEVLNGVYVHRFKSYINVGHHGVFPGFIPWLKTERFDIIHSHGYRQPQSEISSRIGARLATPTILHVHGGFYSRSKWKGLPYRLYDQLARSDKVNVFDHFVVLSEGDRKHLLDLNVRPSKISIIRNAAEPQAFGIVNADQFREKYALQGKRVILYMGILHQYKRPELLMRALPRLVEAEPRSFLLFVGPDGGELRNVQELGRRFRVTPHYKWIGPLQGKEKHEAFESAEFLVLPSDEDPYPLVLLEAMAHNKPVLTTAVVGQAAVISAQEAGIIVAPGDLNGIVEGAIRLFAEPEYRNTIGKNGRRLAERMFSAKAVVDEIESLYWHMLGTKRTQQRG
jgi:glycosyltransferase involved in cell wall biosynthesis